VDVLRHVFEKKERKKEKKHGKKHLPLPPRARVAAAAKPRSEE
jgi:hypothetical protein